MLLFTSLHCWRASSSLSTPTRSSTLTKIAVPLTPWALESTSDALESLQVVGDSECHSKRYRSRPSFLYVFAQILSFRHRWERKNLNPSRSSVRIPTWRNPFWKFSLEPTLYFRIINNSFSNSEVKLQPMFRHSFNERCPRANEKMSKTKLHFMILLFSLKAFLAARSNMPVTLHPTEGRFLRGCLVRSVLWLNHISVQVPCSIATFSSDTKCLTASLRLALRNSLSCALQRKST